MMKGLVALRYTRSELMPAFFRMPEGISYPRLMLRHLMKEDQPTAAAQHAAHNKVGGGPT